MNDEEFLKKYPFTVDGEVVYIVCGHQVGKVMLVDYNHSTYPIKVGFGDGETLFFTSDGRLDMKDTLRTLYHAWENPKIITEPVYPIKSIAVDTLIRVRDSTHDIWTPRYATGEFDADGFIRAWDYGRTSKTARNKNDYVVWSYYEVVE